MYGVQCVKTRWLRRSVIGITRARATDRLDTAVPSSSVHSRSSYEEREFIVIVNEIFRK
jgi:hypothetical protein